LKKFDQGFQRELLGSLADSLFRDFDISVGAGDISTNAASQTAGAQESHSVKKIILVGASNLRRVSVHLTNLGYEVLDLSVPGWKAMPSNVEAVASKLSEVVASGITECAVILDLFGNLSYRYELFDGSTSLPIHMDHGYHLPGEVTVCTDTVFEKLVHTVVPILDAVPGFLRVLIPPQPRYLFSKCCTSPTHCGNVGSAGHAEALLQKVTHLRSVLKKCVQKEVPGGAWVMDTCSAIIHAEKAGVQDRLVALKLVCGSDGVHLSPDGYRNVAKNICATLVGLQSGTLGKNIAGTSSSPCSSVLGEKKSFYWRGFVSPCGATKTVQKTVDKKNRSNAASRSTPYGGRGGGGRYGK
jgi:hypothetical protein